MLSNRQQSMAVRGVGLIQSVADVEDVVLSAAGGVPVYVRDVGKVSVGAAPQTGIFGLTDQTGELRDGVEGIVLMWRWENPSEALRRIREAVDELNASRLPAGVQIAPIHDRTELVNSTLHTVSHTLIEGLVVVTAVLLLLLGSLRTALLTLAGDRSLAEGRTGALAQRIQKARAVRWRRHRRPIPSALPGRPAPSISPDFRDCGATPLAPD